MVASGTVGIVGGSLGGLTAGLVLRDLGFDVTIYERSSEQLQQRGAGIGFLPASYRYLVQRAGVRLDDISVRTDHIRYLDRAGAVVHDANHTYRFSSWNTVYRRLLGCFGTDRYRLAHEVDDFDQTPAEVHVTLTLGRSETVELLVCADGIGSRARRVLLPDAHAAYSGYVAWRGMVPERDLGTVQAASLGDAITYFVYANSHILVYPIPGPDGSIAPGDRLINFVWYRNYLDGGDLTDLMTDSTGHRHDVSLPPGAVREVHSRELRATASARLPALLAELVHATEMPFLQVVVDVEVRRMAFGRVCLLGDAAWVVRPHAAAGTAKAADDAWALGAALVDHPDVPAALAAWEPERLALGRQLLERTRRIGRRSQIDGTWTPGDPELIFGLHGPGD